MFSSPQDARHGRAAGGTRREDGFILLAVLFLVALILITLAVAAPKIAKDIQRDRELELVHRGEQYKRAVRLYYRKFGAYPSTIDQLVNTNQIRFLRKRYTDPMTGKDDWKIIHQGEQHVKIMGLFGQPIAGSGGPAAAGTSIAGIGQSGFGNGTAGALGTSAPSSGVTGTSGSTIGSTGGSTTGSTTGSGGSTDGSAFGQSGFGGTTQNGVGGTPGASGGGSTGLGGGTGGSTNPTFGGGPIVGVKIPDTKASIKEYKQQKHYNEWEFVYDPLEEQLQGGGAMFGGAGANLNGVGNGTTNPTSPTGGFGGTGFGSPTPGTGTSGTGVTNPSPTPTPQQ
jgi:type II secretory pathway pseudopilin PulG